MWDLMRSQMKASAGQRRRGFLALASRAGTALLALIATWLLVGCGGSTPEPVSSAATPQQPAVSSRPIGFAKRVEEKVDESVDLSGVDPDDLFDMAASPPPNFAIVGPAPEARPEDQFFAAIDPTAGTSEFLAVEAPNSAVSSSGQKNSLPRGFTAVADAPLVDGWPAKITCEADKSEMVLIPAGESVVGAMDGPDDCVPEVPVRLNAFYISALEVNVAQFGEFRSSAIKAGDPIEKPVNANSPSNHPALGMAWVEARSYAQMTGRELPTECQWEKAARGAEGLSAPWGNGRPLWRKPRVAGQVDAVGAFPDDRSVYGVFDMAGNAKEWLLDFYSDTNHEDLAIMEPTRRTNWAGPRRASHTGQRVVKGDGPEWAVWFRRGVRMTERDPNVGFRCVLNLPSGS